MCQNYNLTCTDDANAQPAFEVRMKTIASDQGAPARWEFRLLPVGADPMVTEPYELKVEEVDAEYARIDLITNNGNIAYMRKNLAEALLPDVAQRVQRRIQSSPSLGKGAVSRNENANVMWKRLAGKGLATYLPLPLDIYQLNT